MFRIFYIFPVNKKNIIFESYHGKKYSCNPKYLFEYIYNKYGNTYKYIWCYNDKTFPSEYKNVKIVRFLSIRHIYYALTSKYFISNHQVEPFFPVRKSQVVINTWHAVNYKRVDALSPVNKKYRQLKQITAEISGKATKYVVSPCEYFVKNFSIGRGTSEKAFLKIGTPKNDIFFNDYRIKKEKVIKHYNIDISLGIVLYAPTFRGCNRKPDKKSGQLNNIDVENILISLKEKYNKKYLFLYRLHPIINDNIVETENKISVSDYPDMQELLCAADILITDYSSSIWDFSLMYKPCFIYAPDVEKYKKEQGFYIPIEEWQFPLAETNEELIKNIIDLDNEGYKEKVKKHHANFISYETGTACERFCKIVLS